MSVDLIETANRLAAPGKGLLASDESTGTIGKRLEKSGIENTEENRRQYRELFYTADLGNSISGAIMFHETLYQADSGGTPFVECLARQGVLPGIKVDKGLVPLEGAREGETETRGLEALRDDCVAYYKQGARFAKWRAALRIGDGSPSDAAVSRNAQQLADYAAICQSVGLVPIVEPEILIDGSHDAATFAAVSERVVGACVAACWQKGVLLEGALLKPQMVIAGSEYAGAKPDSATIAQLTLRTMRRVVPPALPGIMFLSGGQTEEEATCNLQAINALARAGGGAAPWSLSFSFGRALQASVLKIWSADRSKRDEAREMAAALAAANAAAVRGEYRGPHPSITSSDGSLKESFRGWRTDV